MKTFITWKEKRKIVEEAFASERNVKPTARKYGIQPSNIRRWKKTLDTMSKEQIPEAKKRHVLSLSTLHEGRPRVQASKYDQLRLFYENLRNSGRVVTTSMLCFELRRLDPFIDVALPVLRQRIRRWLRSEGIVQRRATHVAQRTRHDEKIIDDFVQYVNTQISMGSLEGACVVNMDETNVDFDMTSSVTLEERGARTVNVKSSGATGRCSAVLSVTLDGKKLKPLVIFKGKPGGRIAREWTGNTDYPADCAYVVQERGFMDAAIMHQWIEKVWSPFCADKSSTYLLMDEYPPHMCSSVVRGIQDCGSEVDFVPGGYTSKLQVLDVGVNGPFKVYVRSCYEEFMLRNDGKKPRRIDVARWISEAWKKVSVETICNTWTRVGIKRSYDQQ